MNKHHDDLFAYFVEHLGIGANIFNDDPSKLINSSAAAEGSLHYPKVSKDLFFAAYIGPNLIKNSAYECI